MNPLPPASLSEQGENDFQKWGRKTAGVTHLPSSLISEKRGNSFFRKLGKYYLLFTTECEVNALYQWDNVVSMIGRNDILFLFVIEMHPNDTPDIIAKALSRRPFHQVLYIDYANDFLSNNSWLQNRQYKEYNNFLLNNSGRVIAIGNPLNDLQFMKYMKNL